MSYEMSHHQDGDRWLPSPPDPVSVTTRRLSGIPRPNFTDQYNDADDLYIEDFDSRDMTQTRNVRITMQEQQQHAVGVLVGQGAVTLLAHPLLESFTGLRAATLLQDLAKLRPRGDERKVLRFCVRFERILGAFELVLASSYSLQLGFGMVGMWTWSTSHSHADFQRRTRVTEPYLSKSLLFCSVLCCLAGLFRVFRYCEIASIRKRGQVAEKRDDEEEPDDAMLDAFFNLFSDSTLASIMLLCLVNALTLLTCLLCSAYDLLLFLEPEHERWTDVRSREYDLWNICCFIRAITPLISWTLEFLLHEASAHLAIPPQFLLQLFSRMLRPSPGEYKLGQTVNVAPSVVAEEVIRSDRFFQTTALQVAQQQPMLIGKSILL